MTYHASPLLSSRDQVHAWISTLPGRVIRVVAVWSWTDRTWRVSAQVGE